MPHGLRLQKSVLLQNYTCLLRGFNTRGIFFKDVKHRNEIDDGARCDESLILTTTMRFLHTNMNQTQQVHKWFFGKNILLILFDPHNVPVRRVLQIGLPTNIFKQLRSISPLLAILNS